MILIETAGPGDFEAIRGLLDKAGLPTRYLHENLNHFLVARSSDGDILGCIGLEIYGDSALLRSLVVHTDFRGQKIGDQLCRQIIHKAREAALYRIVLLTMDAVEYMKRFGFEQVKRSEITGLIKESWEFKVHECDDAVCMYLEIPVRN